MTKKNNLTARDNFFLVAAHQLKLPLNTLRLNLEMVASGDLGKINSQIKKNINQAIKIDNQMLELVTDFLNAAAIEKQERPPVSRLDIIKEIKNIIQDETILAKRINVSLKLTVEPASLKSLSLPVVNFKEVIKNLISNAIKYNRPRGSVNIKIKKVAAKVFIEIKDTGIGIPAKDQKKMFNKFFRANNALKKTTEGTGLGLFIAKSYVESWGGRINFTSRENKGTTFYIEIPVK